ncbi:MAG: exodeoxyribonuclease V subunit gamma [Clostridia bacterium]|nr:exodeoxyribonuclease V subunit gamma [Clostridia bacterium]
MIKIVYGPVGTGKSTHIYNCIIDDLKNGRKPILIVPDQQVLSAERTIVDMAEGVSTLELEVLSFGRLSNHVFRSLGGLSFSDIDEGGKLLIMWRVLRETSAFLKAYADYDDRNIAIAELMLSTVNELKQFSVTPEMLDRASKKLRSEHPDLSNKLHDLGLIFATYQAFLSKEYNDPIDELTRLADTLKNSNFFADTNIYFDSFDAFTPQQSEVITQMIVQSDSVVFSLCYDPFDNSGIFNTTERTFEKLKKLAKRFSLIPEMLYLSDNHSFKYPDLAYASKNLWNHNVNKDDYFGDSSHINTISCHDLFEECEAVACDILRKVRNGARYKDILVIARDISKYEGIIDTELENNGVPFFMSRRSDITTKPIFKLILASLAVHNRNWQYNDVISYLKTGLAGVSYDECDILENYASTWNINGRRWHDGIEWNMNPDGFTDRLSADGQNIIKRANEIRNKVVPPLEKLFDSIGDSTVSDITRALYIFLTELGVREQIEKKAAKCHNEGNYVEEKELVQLWNILMKCLDTAVELVGDMKLSGEGYATVIGIILRNTSIGTIPATVDQVMLGSASKIRSGGVPHVYLLGVNEGEFPRAVSENCIFNDNEKNILKLMDLELSPGTDELTGDELFWFYKAVSSATESLTLTYCNSDLKGAANRISVAGSRLGYLFDKKPIIYAQTPPIEKIQGRDIALKMMSLQRGTSLGEALKGYFADDSVLSDVVSAFESPIEAGDSDIDRDLAEDIYKGDLSTSQSKVDTYIKCSFNYHCKYILGLEEKKTAVFKANDIGTFVHAVFEMFISRIATENGINTDITDAEISSIISEIVSDYLRKVCNGIPESSPRFLSLIKRLQNTTELLVHNIIAEFKQSDFVPRFFELPIKKDAEDGVDPYAIPLGDGSYIFMKGFADRVDTYKKGKDVYVRIVDYKTGTKTFSPNDIDRGLNLQLLLYLFAVWNTKKDSFKEKIGCEGDIIPAGIIYFSAKAPNIDIKKEDEIDSVYSNAVKKVRRMGLVLNDPDILEAMDKGITGKYIPVRFVKKTNDYSAPELLKTVEEFGAIERKIENILKSIAKNMKSGVVKAKPLEVNNPKESPCLYCKMKAICRRTEKGGE